MEKTVTLTYVFLSEVLTGTLDEALENFEPTLRHFEYFARSVDSRLTPEIFELSDGTYVYRIVFYIEGTKHSVLEKVAALFSLAALFKFCFGNQYYLPEQATQGTFGK